MEKFITLMMINKDIQIFNPNKKFNNVTDVKEVFRFINKNLKEMENLIEFQTIIEKIAEQMKLDSDLILQKYYLYKKLKII